MREHLLVLPMDFFKDVVGLLLVASVEWAPLLLNKACFLGEHFGRGQRAQGESLGSTHYLREPITVLM